MLENSSTNFSNFYGSNILVQSKDKTDNLLNLDIEPIHETDYSSHYLCTKCLKFPFIKFCKDKKNIKVTCSCFNNKKILIKNLYDNSNNISIESSYINLLSTTNINVSNKNFENIFICNKHNKKFKYFSKFFLNNYCEDCIKYKKDLNINSNNDIIRFKDIKIEDEKINQILKIINNNNVSSFKEISEIKNYQISDINDSHILILSEEEEKQFNKLIRIIIYDYKNFPNFSHFFNIKNLIDFFNIEDKFLSESKKEYETIENELNRNIEPIIIKYINNSSGKIKLFSNKFVLKNEEKLEIEIEDKIIDLNKEYEFNKNDEIVTVKLFVKKGVLEIDMYKMFSNCSNLISIDGVSKLKKIKIINIKKMFYNCLSLSSLPDFNYWEINKQNSYLMFYNCISLAFFPYKNELNINEYDDKTLGLIITKYFKLKKEISINNIIEYRGYINLFGNRCKINNKKNEIMIIDGKDKRELIACYKDEIKNNENNENEIIIFSNNESNIGKN